VRRLRLSTFRRGFASTLGLDVISRGLSAIATVLFIRALDVDDFALVVLFLNVGQFAGGALTGGVRMRYMRAEAERVSRGDPNPTSFALAWLASLALVIGATTLCLAGLGLLGPEGPGPGWPAFVGLIAVFTAGHASIELAMYHHQANLEFVRAGLIGISRSAALLAVATAAAVGLLESGTAIIAAAAVAVLGAAAFACIPLAWRTMRAQGVATIRGDLGRESGWLTVYYLLSAGVSYASIFTVAALLDDEAVASFGAALRYIAIVLGPTPALLAILRVRTSQQDIVDSAEAQTRMLMGWIRRAIVPVVGLLGVAIALGPLFIPIVDGGRYPDSVPIFQLLLIGAMFAYITMPSPNLLMSQRRFRLLAGFYAVALIVQVAVLGLAAELAGVVAVAGATAAVRASETSALAYLATRVRRPADTAVARAD
jgi:O-antigen/teichoic acid export membrane protein